TVEESAAGVALGASPSERARAEVWLPLWESPASLSEVQHLCTEGRAEWNGRQARDAVEFAQAVAALGVARGVDDFVRYAIHQRMGKNHVATPVGRIRVRPRQEVDLLAGVDWWLRRFRDRVGESAPAALRDRRHRLEQAIYELCTHGGRRATRAVLVELGRCELALGRREAPAADVPALELSSAWLRDADDRSAAFRLGAGLGSLGAGTPLPLRSNLEAVATERGRPVRTRTGTRIVDIAAPEARMAAVLRRRVLDAGMLDDARLAFAGRRTVALRDIGALLRGLVDLGAVIEVMDASSLVRWPPGTDDDAMARVPPALPRAYAVLKLCCLPFGFELAGRRYEVSVEPGVLAALAAGQVAEAIRRAATRLRGSGLQPHPAAGSPELAAGVSERALLAALLVPISASSAAALAAAISIPDQSEVPT
ncbi:MAG TPA: type I-U CRISPR-associated protein Csx17, partial [Candidatus Dormibacteraeota bacterium]|nr:type I-U CRISPR-associated protein Csx17 [Candidatus Dormibacteraeota bacterium]